ncbi:hypothetical protein ACTFR8_23255 [Bacillus cereus group sp. MYBK15-3]|uniref:hypothetical protein n=1 Tax=Bacillus cereus group TaxID=86661 RepID=UPI001C8B1F43|nr:hypothetical protein [Bacillus cereus]MBX9158517.1 hypothetical protein [Bacillus cereus]
MCKVEEYPTCKRCGKPVVKGKKDYSLFEGMHWVCFHFEFEHGEFDPDEPCNDPGCVWNRIKDKEDGEEL